MSGLSEFSKVGISKIIFRIYIELDVRLTREKTLWKNQII